MGQRTVYHLAAVILSPDPTAFERVNRHGTATWWPRRPAPGSSTSSTSRRRRSPTRGCTRYAQSKLAGEALVKAERRLRHTIVRPTLVYDEQRRARSS